MLTWTSTAERKLLNPRAAGTIQLKTVQLKMLQSDLNRRPCSGLKRFPGRDGCLGQTRRFGSTAIRKVTQGITEPMAEISNPQQQTNRSGGAAQFLADGDSPANSHARHTEATIDGSRAARATRALVSRSATTPRQVYCNRKKQARSRRWARVRRAENNPGQ